MHKSFSKHSEHISIRLCITKKLKLTLLEKRHYFNFMFDLQKKGFKAKSLLAHHLHEYFNLHVCLSVCLSVRALITLYCPKCFATGMGQFPICKLKWDWLRTSVTACTIDKNKYIFCPIWNLLCENGNLKRNFSKKKHIQTPNGVLLIFKLPFPNGSYRNRV